MYWGNNKIPKMLKYVPDHLKTKKMFKTQLRNCFFVTIYVTDRYDT